MIIPAAFSWREISGYPAGRTEQGPVADSRQTELSCTFITPE